MEIKKSPVKGLLKEVIMKLPLEKNHKSSKKSSRRLICYII